MTSLKALENKYSRMFCVQKVEIRNAFKENGIPATEEEQIAVLIHHLGREVESLKRKCAGFKGEVNKRNKRIQQLEEQNASFNERIEQLEHIVSVVQKRIAISEATQSRQKNYHTQSIGVRDNSF